MKRTPPAGPLALACLYLAAGACLSACLSACHSAEPVAGAADIALADSMRPADPALAQQYQRSCLLCHASGAAKAPLSGFTAAWKPRLRQGMPTLLQHVRQGYKAMPANGYCNDCSDADVEKLIRFMAGGERRGAA